MKIDNTRDSILKVASKLFGRFGFYKTSMDEIARIARKAKGSVYYHFASKEELFREVVSNEFALVKTQLVAVVDDSGLSPSGKLKIYIIKRTEALLEAKNYHETLHSDFYEHFSFTDDLHAEFTNWERNTLKIIVNDGIAKGIFTKSLKVDVAIEALILVLTGVEVPFFVQNKYSYFSPHFDDLVNIILKGISE
jgi:AcrR family transcriptional regulator